MRSIGQLRWSPSSWPEPFSSFLVAIKIGATVVKPRGTGQGRTSKTERELESPIFGCHALGIKSSPEGDTSCVGCSTRLRVDVRVRRWTERGKRDHDGAQPGSAAAHDHQAAVTAAAASTASSSGRDLRAAATAACGCHATTRQATPPARRSPTGATEKEKGSCSGVDHIWAAFAA